MGIRLTTPKVTGDYDSVDYQDVRVVNVNWSLVNEVIRVHYQLGNFDDVSGEFTPGFEGVKEYVVQDVPDGDQDYTTVWDETFKQGTDTNAERFIEMLTNLLQLRLGLPGATIKPGRSGKRVI